MKIKVVGIMQDKPTEAFWLVSYKQVGMAQYRVNFSYDYEHAGDFDEDDYIRQLCGEHWFPGKMEVIL